MPTWCHPWDIFHVAIHNIKGRASSALLFPILASRELSTHTYLIIMPEPFDYEYPSPLAGYENLPALPKYDDFPLRPLR